MEGRLSKSVDDALRELPFEALGLRAPLMRRVAAYMIRENFAAFYEEHGPLIAWVMAWMLKEIPERVRDGHNRALEDTRDNK